MAFDPYEILGVPRNADAAQIKRAWRSKAQQVHPDRHPDDPFAGAKMQQVQEAYEILSDPARRARFDAEGKTAKNNLDQRAAAFFRVMALKILDTFEDDDIVGHLNASIESSRRAALAGKAKAERAIASLERKLKRYCHKSGSSDNLLTNLIQVRIEAQRAAVLHAVGAIEEIAGAEKLVAEYERVFADNPGMRTAFLDVGLLDPFAGGKYFGSTSA